jgi:hypothetical protein
MFLEASGAYNMWHPYISGFAAYIITMWKKRG